MGLELTTLRPRAMHSSNLDSQAPQVQDNLMLNDLPIRNENFAFLKVFT